MNVFNFNNTYTNLHDNLYTKLLPTPVTSPKIVLYNKNIATKLGITGDNLEQYLSGNKVDEGSTPFAQGYAGHQFGHFNILGDGRAIMLGEHITPKGDRFDIQLKGSGRTPYSRNGDGRATLYSMLREYVISYSMDKLNIPTTLSLGVVSTGEDVYREKIEQGGILTRVASSHIRVGTFQFVASKGDLDQLKTFTDYVIDRHFPEIIDNKNPYVSLLEVVMDRQIDLILNWLRVGFIHGVMNTDNVSICGETIDYGPCAFMDLYNPKTVFSSIDRNGRYSYENQKNIGQWNIARFAECLVPLINSDSEASLEIVNKIISSYQDIFAERWLNMMAKKIGLKVVNKELVLTLLNWMEANKSDFTNVFRALESDNFLELVPNSNSELTIWYDSWLKENPDKNLIINNNPIVIPRNHIVEDVLIKASDGSDIKPLQDLLDVLADPYNNSNVNSYYKDPPEIVNSSYKTYCGT